MKNKEKNYNLIEASFLNKSGKLIDIKDVIDVEKDCWFHKSSNKWIVKHSAIKQIASIAGISKNYEVIESDHIVPDYRNELQNVVRVKIMCKANASKEFPDECVHGERTLTVTGEATRLSCANRGREYLRKMSEKRAYDIAVIEHLNLSSMIFSEEEATDFEEKKEPNLMPGMLAFEAIVTEINALLNAKDDKELKKFGKKIKAGIKIKKYNDMQLKYLRDLYQKEFARRHPAF